MAKANMASEQSDTTSQLQMAGGAAAGAAAGSLIGPIGAAVGAGVGAGVGAAATNDGRSDRVTIEEHRAPSVTERTCVEGPNGTKCVETKR